MWRPFSTSFVEIVLQAHPNAPMECEFLHVLARKKRPSSGEMRAKSIRGKLTLRFKAGGAVENTTLATNVSKGLSQVSRTKVTT
jgi:hypothetical protein